MNSLSPPIKYKASPLRLMFYAIFFSLLLFMLLPLSRMFQDYTVQKEMARTIELATTPPPPKQKQELEEALEAEEVVEIEHVQSEIEVEPLDVKLEVSLQGDLQVKIEMANFTVTGGRDAILEDIKMFSLTELDEMPVSINEALFVRDNEIGYDAIDAMVHVTLTEVGELEFIQFVSLNNQNAREAIIEYVEKLKFTAPTKDGMPARSNFKLPVRFARISLGQRQEQRRLEGRRPGVSASGVTPP